MYTLDQGAAAVAAARANLTARLAGRKPRKEELWPEGLPAGFEEQAGVFVTLLSYPQEELRGCVGYPEPVLALGRAVVDSAFSAATRDVRFPSVKASELEALLVEVTLLGPPQRLVYEKPTELLELVKIGRDGLIIDKGLHRGVLLPQVPMEHGWETAEYLSHGCLKAGLMADAWLAEPGLEVFTFTGQLFKEQSPGGKVLEIEIS